MFVNIIMINHRICANFLVETSKKTGFQALQSITLKYRHSIHLIVYTLFNNQ